MGGGGEDVFRRRHPPRRRREAKRGKADFLHDEPCADAEGGAAGDRRTRTVSCQYGIGYAEGGTGRIVNGNPGLAPGRGGKRVARKA